MTWHDFEKGRYCECFFYPTLKFHRFALTTLMETLTAPSAVVNIFEYTVLIIATAESSPRTSSLITTSPREAEPAKTSQQNSTKKIE